VLRGRAGAGSEVCIFLNRLCHRCGPVVFRMVRKGLVKGMVVLSEGQFCLLSQILLISPVLPGFQDGCKVTAQRGRQGGQAFYAASK
jgi:hypothetical protein